MDDDTLATVIPFPSSRRGRVPVPDHEPDRLQEYWAFVQRLAAERRDLTAGGRAEREAGRSGGGRDRGEGSLEQLR